MKYLVLVGAGHAHLLTLSRTREFVAHGIEVTLIAPGRFWYSGMGPGMISCFYEPADDTVNVRALVERGGGSFIKDGVARINPAERELQLCGGRIIRYDAVSLNVGSEVPLDLVPGATEFATAVKPIKNLLALRDRLLRDTQEELRIVIIGGGAAGSEVCANIWHLLRPNARAKTITLVSSEDRLLSEAPPRASAILEKYLQSLEVRVVLRTRALRVNAGEVVLENAERLRYDVLVAAIGIRAPVLLREAGLPCARDGSMRVNEFLQSTAHPEIFGAGDCICFGERCLPRIGVYAVRQAPILYRNLRAFLAGKPLNKFQPQKRYLLILNLGDGTGLLTRGLFVKRGRWAFWLKDRLDRQFVSKFQM